MRATINYQFHINLMVAILVYVTHQPWLFIFFIYKISANTTWHDQPKKYGR